MKHKHKAPGEEKENWYAQAVKEKEDMEQAQVPPDMCELFDGTLVDRKTMWTMPKYTEEEMQRSVVEETSFATLFPTYMEAYLKKVWPDVELVLKMYQCKGELNLTEGSMTVRTTKRSWDPWAIVNARNFITLLSRSVPLQQARKIFDEDMYMEIVKLGGFVASKERFVKRRQRLLGPEGKTLKALELLTDCYILVQGKTVAVMGHYKGVQAVKRIAEDCMRNIHPIYGLKRLLVQRELSQDQAVQVETWAKWLPEFKKPNLKRAKRKKLRRETKLKSPFPPPQTPRKEDLEMETGEYWLKKEIQAPRHQRKQPDDAASGTTPHPQAGSKRPVKAEKDSETRPKKAKRITFADLPQ